MKSVNIALPKPHAGQDKVLQSKARFIVLACGRRFGKSTLGINKMIQVALAGYPVAYFCPTYKMTAEIWREVVRIISPAASRISSQDKRIELKTGGVIDMWSLDGPDAARGRKYKFVVVDEAAMITNLKEAWQAAIRPTLTDYKGGAYFMSTPKGQNYFRELFNYGLSPDPLYSEWESFHLPTVDNPYIDASEVQSASNDIPERLYQQEYEARFLEDAGGVFRGVAELAVLTPLDEPEIFHEYVMGVDLAKKIDYTVAIVLDICCDPLRVVGMLRFNNVEWDDQTAALRDYAHRFRVKRILVDQTGLGDPFLTMLRREITDIPVAGFILSGVSKPRIIKSLVLAIEKNEILLLNEPNLISELQSYEETVNPLTGRSSYSAPAGYHDDCVMALSLALYSAIAGRITTVPNILEPRPPKRFSMDTRS